MPKKTNKDIFLVCQINAINEWYDEEYKGPDKEVMKKHHATTMEYLYEPVRFKTPGRPTKDETKLFMDVVKEAVKQTAGKHMKYHDMITNTTLML
jgi:hypothetical protein